MSHVFKAFFSSLRLDSQVGLKGRSQGRLKNPLQTALGALTAWSRFMHRATWLPLLGCCLLLGTIFSCNHLTPAAQAKLTGESVVYTVNDRAYEGYFAKNDSLGDQQPLVFLIHDWNGLGDYEKRRTDMLAQQGYAAFAIDLYGQGVRPTTVAESQAESGKLYNDRAELRSRLFGSLEAAQALPGIDSARIVAIGYCFGGAAALEFARSGADLNGFVSFHGGLATPEGQDYQNVRGSVLILHGADDPVAPMSEVAALADAMTAGGVDFDLEIYGGVHHSFTEWSATGDVTQYDPEADRKSWAALLTFLADQWRV